VAQALFRRKKPYSDKTSCALGALPNVKMGLHCIASQLVYVQSKLGYFYSRGLGRLGGVKLKM
jgi:hypothetical protein